MTGSAMHRLAQFWRHTSARVTAGELNTVRDLLGPGLSPFFTDLPVNDQRHGLDVLDTIRRLESHPPVILQQAALLHDMGKVGAHLSVVERSFTVLLLGISSWLLDVALRARPRFAMRYATYANHARIGSDRLRGAGAVDLAAVVAEHHAAQPSLDVTRRLQRADKAN
jgi:hypothetical protein